MTARRLLSLCILLLLNLLLGLIYLHSSRVVTVMRWNTNDTVIWNAGNSSLCAQEQSSSNPTVRRGTRIRSSEPILPHPYKYLISNTDLCSWDKYPNQRKLSLVILVCSSLNNTEQRKAVRETWGLIVRQPDIRGSVRLGFLLGYSSNETTQRAIVEESVTHNDIIQENFIDSYQNLTLKSVMLLKWVSEFCPNVHFILKTDDDMYVNVPTLLTTLSKLIHRANVLFGVLFRKAKPNRNPTAKWFVPKSQFEGEVFPDYLSGTGYVMTRDVVPKLFQASFDLPFLVMEDVFITGVCASEAGVRRVNIGGFAHWRRSPTGCAFRDVITGHHVTPKDMRKIWNELQNKKLVCKGAKKVS